MRGPHSPVYRTARRPGGPAPRRAPSAFPAAPAGPWSRSRSRNTTHSPAQMEPSPAEPADGRAEVAPETGVVAPSAAASAPAEPGARRTPVARPVGSTRPSLPPGLRIPYNLKMRERRKPPRPAGAASAAPAVANVCGSPPSPGSGPAGPAVPDIPPPDLPSLLGQIASALPARAMPTAVRDWLLRREAALSAVDWPHDRDAFEAAHPRDAPIIASEVEAFWDFTSVAGYDARPAGERNFASLVRSVSACAEWIRRMPRCNPGRLCRITRPGSRPSAG